MYGGDAADYASSIQQTTDGGYIVAGVTGLFESGSGKHILKLNSDGSLAWQKTYGEMVMMQHLPSNKRQMVDTSLLGLQSRLELVMKTYTS